MFDISRVRYYERQLYCQLCPSNHSMKKCSLFGQYFNKREWNTSRLPVCKKFVKYCISEKNNFSVVIFLSVIKDEEVGDNHSLSMSPCSQRLKFCIVGKVMKTTNMA